MLKTTLGALDYIMFVMLLVVSLGIGIFHAFKSRGASSIDYLRGGGKMRPIPVAVSLMVTFSSSIMVLGDPAEVYRYGFIYWWFGIGLGASFWLAALVTAPVFHRLQLTSVYEYFELRYQSAALRRFCMAIGMLYMLLYNGVVLYGAGVALQTFLDIPIWTTIIFMEAFTVVYTGIGGIKAVIWTDVLQSAVLIVGIIATIIKGTIVVGGFENLYNLNKKGGRLHMLNFDFDPTTRHTVWTLTIVAALRMISFGFHPATIQRTNSVPTLKDARVTLVTAGIFCFLLETIAVCTGLIAYAYFSEVKCDPFEIKQLTNPNQILPFLVIQLFGEIPGLVGIFLAALLSASLSTISSLLSGLSAMFSEDIMRSCFASLSDKKLTLAAKLSVPIFGAIATGFGIMASQMRGPLTQITSLFSGAASGPLSGIFLLSIFLPWASAVGVSVAGAVGLAFSTWTLIGRIMADNAKINPPPLSPASVENCLSVLNGAVSKNGVNYKLHNETLMNASLEAVYTVGYSTLDSLTMIQNTTDRSLQDTLVTMIRNTTDRSLQDTLVYPAGIDQLYSVSYQTLGLLTIVLTILVGLLTNYLTRSRAPRNVPKYSTRKLSEVFCCCVHGDPEDGDKMAAANEEQTSFI